MRVLILSDIHGNYQALECVLTHVPHDVIFCCGDFVVDFPFPEECVSLLMERQAHACMGNNDHVIVNNIKPSSQLKEPYLNYGEALDRGVELTHRLMSDETKTFLSGLSREYRLTIDNTSFYLNHTAPDLPIYQYIHLDTPLTEVVRIYRGVRTEVIVTGHTHIPYVKKVGGSLLINPGSVGEPRDGDPRASYAVFDTHTGQVVLGRIAYDAAQTRKRLKELCFPNFSLYCLKYGKLPGNPDDDGSG